MDNWNDKVVLCFEKVCLRRVLPNKNAAWSGRTMEGRSMNDFRKTVEDYLKDYEDLEFICDWYEIRLTNAMATSCAFSVNMRFYQRAKLLNRNLSMKMILIVVN